MLRKKKPKPKNTFKEMYRLTKHLRGRDSGTRSRVSKGPARDAKHLERIRSCPCLVCGATRNQAIWGGIQAHHVRCIGPRTMGKRVSDYITTPLCNYCHARLHEHDEASWWASRCIDPRAFIRSFSPEGRAALDELESK